jgi:hypothetical protein
MVPISFLGRPPGSPGICLWVSGLPLLCDTARMLGYLISLSLIGGAGYVGYRLGKGGTTIHMNPVDVQAVRRRAANQDMNLVRKEGEIAIAQTIEGTVWFQYDHGVYTITKPDGRGGVITLATGSPKVVRPILESLYDVVVQPA